MLINNENLLFSCRQNFPEGTARLIFMADAPASKETVSAQPEEAGEFKGEIPYDKSKEWQINVTDLMNKALGDKYKNKLSPILNDIEDTQNQLLPVLDNVNSIELKQGVLIFKDKEGKMLVSFYVADGMRETMRKSWLIDRSQFHRRASVERYNAVGSEMPFRDNLLRLQAAEQRRNKENTAKALAAGPKRAAETNTGTSTKTPAESIIDYQENPEKYSKVLGPQLTEALERNRKIARARNAERGQILASVESMSADKYEIRARISPTIAVEDKDEFARQWQFYDYSEEIIHLFNENPDGARGYRVNPFKAFGWNPETLRALIDNSGSAWEKVPLIGTLLRGDKGEELKFTDVSRALYNGHYKELREDLKKQGISEELLKQMDEISLLSKIPIIGLIEKLDGEESEDLLPTYKKLKALDGLLGTYANIESIPKGKENDLLRKLFPVRDQLKQVVQALGDYIVYINKLVNLVGDMRYRPGVETQDRARTIMEYEGGVNPENGEYKPSKENIIKRALLEVFFGGKSAADGPKEYTSELKYLFVGTAHERPINFYDLNGQTATVEGEWFTTYQSSESAYKVAYEEIIKQENGKDVYEKGRVVPHFNNLLQLGIAGYEALQSKRPLSAIIEDLAKAGVEVEKGVPLRFAGNGKDTQNLFRALSLTRLGDLYKEDSDQAKKIKEVREMFMKVGSVIWQKSKHQEQVTEGKKAAENINQIRAKIGLSDEQAQMIVDKINETRKFNQEQLVKIKSALVGGAAVVLPDAGGGFFVHYEFDNGVFLDLGGSFPGWNSFAPGAAIGTKFQPTEDITVSIGVGGGYNFGGGGGWESVGVGVGGKISKKISKSDWSISADAGVGLVGGVIPMGFVGVGVSRGFQEKYERTLTKAEAKNHITELDKSKDVYAEVRSNPSQYPEVAKILYAIDNIGLSLDENSKREMFLASYEMFKADVQSQAIDDSAPAFYERIVGGGLKFVKIAGVVPIILPYIELNLYGRKVLYRVATDMEDANLITDIRAGQEILKSYGEQAEIAPKKLKSSGQLTMDTATGELILKTSGEGKIDFKELNQFNAFKDELNKNANIYIEPMKNGLMEMRPMEAYGNVKVFVDPRMNTDVTLVPRGGKLFLSIAKDKEIFIKREDITYPFPRDGATEDTVIIISNNPAFGRETIEQSSDWYVSRTPTTEWQIKPRHQVTISGEENKKQNNIFTWKDYESWFGEGKSDRVEFADSGAIEKAYSALENSVSLSGEEANAKVEIRKDVAEKIAALSADKDFIQKYRSLTTEGYDFMRKKGGNINANWSENFPELVQILKKEIRPDLNEMELNAALMSLLVASFMNIQKHGEKESKELYLDWLEKFERPMLTSIFKRYYEGNPEKDKKTEANVNWILEQLGNVDVTTPGATVEAGTLFATLVGMGGYTGMRHMYNYSETKPQFGLVGGRDLDVTASGTPGEVARFWLRKLSPYLPEFQNNPIPSAADAEKFNEYQKNMNGILRSPLALKLVPLVGVTLSADEMNKLAKVYENGLKGGVIVNNENIGVVKKFLDVCDKVRAAETSGKKEVWVDEKRGFKILIVSTKVTMGVYKKCGNITGIMQESFALIHEGSKQIYFAGKAEGYIDVASRYWLSNRNIMLALGIPLATKEEVGGRPAPGGGGGGKKNTGETTDDLPPEIEVPPTAKYVPPAPPTAKPLPGPEEAPGVNQNSGNTSTSGNVPGAAENDGSSV